MALGWIWGHPWCRGTLRGKRGAWRRSRRRTWRHASCFCVAGVALDNIDLPFAWQAWHLATSTCLLRGRRGTYGTGLDLVAHLVPLVARDIAPLCVAGVALGDIDLPFCVAGVAPSHIHAAYAWQAWHLLTHNSFTHITCTQLCHTHTTYIRTHGTTLLPTHTCSETSYRITDVECIARAKTLQLNLTGMVWWLEVRNCARKSFYILARRIYLFWCSSVRLRKPYSSLKTVGKTTCRFLA